MTYKTYKEIEGTWVCQFNKPENKAKLKMYKNDKDRSLKKLIEYYRWVISVLINTPAWGVSGVNKIVNELTDAAVLTTSSDTGDQTIQNAQRKVNATSDYGNISITFNENAPSYVVPDPEDLENADPYPFRAVLLPYFALVVGIPLCYHENAEAFEKIIRRLEVILCLQT